MPNPIRFIAAIRRLAPAALRRAEHVAPVSSRPRGSEAPAPAPGGQMASEPTDPLRRRIESAQAVLREEGLDRTLRLLRERTRSGGGRSVRSVPAPPPRTG